jgi:hypothetical protein
MDIYALCKASWNTGAPSFTSSLQSRLTPYCVNCLDVSACFGPVEMPA